MTFAERRAQQDPSVPMRTVRDVRTGEVLGHFRVSDELVERVLRPVPSERWELLHPRCPDAPPPDTREV